MDKPRAWVAAGYASFDDYVKAELGELANELIAGERRERFSPAPASPGDDDGPLRLIDLRDVPSRWPTVDGMVATAPDAWRWRDNPERLAVVDSFYRDLLWAVQLEVDGVEWPGRGHRDGVSVVAACRDVARLWSLPSAETTLPAPSGRGRIRVPAGCDTFG